MWCYDFLYLIERLICTKVYYYTYSFANFSKYDIASSSSSTEVGCGAGSDLNVGVKGVSSSSIIAAAVLVATVVPDRTASKRVFSSSYDLKFEGATNLQENILHCRFFLVPHQLTSIASQSRTLTYHSSSNHLPYESSV